MSIEKIGVGVIGLGAISQTYLDNMHDRFAILDIVGVTTRNAEKTKAVAERYGCQAMSMEEMLDDSRIQIIVNLTNVWSHYEINKAALEHGKHVYSEKMIAENFTRGKELYEIAKKKGLRFAVGPDTFLGGGIQTCRKLIDDGFIGKPFAVTASIIRSYRPDSRSGRIGNVLSEGGTIPYDMGGYYLHAMFQLFGGVKRVCGFCTHMPKVWSNPGNPNYGKPLAVESPNLMQASLEFECGVFGSLLAGDSGIPQLDRNLRGPGLYVYGTAGTLYVPDPNTFGGPVRILKQQEFIDMPLTHGYTGEPEPFVECRTQDFWASSMRGIGVADMAWAIRNNRPQRIANEMGLHAIEVLHGVERACRAGQYYEMTTRLKRPIPLRSGFTGPDAEDVLNDYFS